MKKEFAGYDTVALQSDLFAGVTVAAVALPLALAFGVSSGADAASGLISAIISAFVIGALSGASFQISGPTGAMTAILMPLAARFGIQGVLAAGAIAGLILLLAGVLHLGKLVYYLPAPVITGFTSGIAVLIAMGQMENLLGVKSEGAEVLERFLGIFTCGSPFNFYALFLGLAVIVIMFAWPRKWAEKIPGSLAAVLAATVVTFVLRLPVDLVGDIPRTLIHGSRISLFDLFHSHIGMIAIPAISIAALGMIESLLCGVAGGRMKQEKLDGDRELIAQGLGNILLPFLGGVPATAAIARSSVAIKSGGRTRLTGIFQGFVLLMSMFLLSPIMSRIPLSALAGVLIVTAWRMNEWHSINYIFGRKFKWGAAKFLITLTATVVFDLTIAIAAGAMFAMIMFISKISDLDVSMNEITSGGTRKAEVVYITGPLFFGSTESFENEMLKAGDGILVLSLRGLPYIDTSGVQSLFNFCSAKIDAGSTIFFAGVSPKVKEMLDRGGITVLVDESAFFKNAIDAAAVVERLKNL